MFQRSKIADTTNTADKINKQFVSNPIASKDEKISHASIFEKVQKLESCQDQNLRSENISEIVDLINHLQGQELIKLMSNEDEIVRSLAARAYVDNSPEFSVDTLKSMIKDNNECIRDSAVMALCYINSNEVLDLLCESTKDRSNSIQMRALAGIADIAAECSSGRAKEILEKFLTDKNAEIRQFVKDELSFLS